MFPSSAVSLCLSDVSRLADRTDGRRQACFVFWERQTFVHLFLSKVYAESEPRGWLLTFQAHGIYIAANCGAQIGESLWLLWVKIIFCQETKHKHFFLFVWLGAEFQRRSSEAALSLSLSVLALVNLELPAQRRIPSALYLLCEFIPDASVSLSSLFHSPESTMASWILLFIF